jgi:hypothetical protein
MNEQKYLAKQNYTVWEREMTLPNRMLLRPGLLWLTLNLTLIIQYLSRNNISLSILHTPSDIFAYPEWYENPRLKTTDLYCQLQMRN